MAAQRGLAVRPLPGLHVCASAPLQAAQASLVATCSNETTFMPACMAERAAWCALQQSQPFALRLAWQPPWHN